MEEAKDIIKERQRVLEIAILQAVLDYERHTGMCVRDISFVDDKGTKAQVNIVSTLE